MKDLTVPFIFSVVLLFGGYILKTNTWATTVDTRLSSLEAFKNDASGRLKNIDDIVVRLDERSLQQSKSLTNIEQSMQRK